MSTDLTVDADLDFTVDLPGARTLRGSLTGSGKHLQLRVSDPSLFAGRSDASAVRGIADGLARQGVCLTVVAPARGALPQAELAPPATMFPLAPTFRRRPRPPVTTTHDPHGGGNPRLIMASVAHPLPGDRQQVFRLRGDVTRIGSDAACAIRLAGLDPFEAEVRHDAADEFVVVRLGRPGITRVNGAPVDTALLRTASRLNIGGWTLSFYREEHADHGRPYGGRVGGEIGHQRRQPPRHLRPAHPEENQ